ncbi:MAG TPA: hypothetical protein PLP55_05195 [Phycicoccus elongatus]|jgi:hypothetical protein|uniref:hypothetical protein n=1 Tax=Phycicoccus TaxID=367298 RepID=UPI0025878E2C|nr:MULTISPECIES: hypothetical protein [Phycicoccus]MCO5302544.1 hypothetical protein [Phycicoccus sp.]HPF75925.1 hypothetical protein [Phycicoccus elongatus]HPK12060.1 hypothetical protein [Phycicoccus elongatus]HRC16916.1 hypothetical protein [Phycicoccus elongatus]HRV57103.1 hypothetical protein [Phycicoccus sp.]
MHALLTALLGLTGAGLALWGFGRTLRHRYRARRPGFSRLGRRSGWALYAAGGLLLFLPDVLAGVLVAAGSASSDVTAVLGTLAWLLWRAAVVLGWGIGAIILALTSERVVRPVHGGVTRVVAAVPRRDDLAHARLRRQAGYGDFPREWAALIEHDRALAHRLLGQGNHFEETAHQAALRDWSDPVTVRAMEALVECDRVRTPVPPRGTRDVIGTDYGRAVAAFEQAVTAAEANAADRHATAS